MAASIGIRLGARVSSSLNGDGIAPRAGAALLALDSVAAGGLAECEAVVDGQPDSLIVHRADMFGLAQLYQLHGASFDLRDGLCVAGPCRGERLRDVAVEVRDGGVFLAAP